MGTQIGTWPAGDGVVDFGATLDGNYGFTEGCLATGYDSATGECLPDGTGVRPLPTPLKPDEYLVAVAIPDDPLRPGKKLFQVTREEDVNMYDGDTFIPAVVPPACAGAMHVVDIAGVGADGPDAVNNPAYAEAGGSRFEGQQKPLCDVKLVPLSNAKSIAPIFTLFTDVPIPGKWKGYIINDLVVSTNPKNLFFGEMAGVPNIPIGVYDFIGRRVTTVYSDWNGVYEVLLPSSATTNAPTPSGLNAGMYYIYGNDPGDPMAPDPLYNPQYRSIGATFEIYPGVMVPSDLAPVNNGAWLLAPGQQFHEPARCALPATTPQIFAVSRPYGSHGEWITIDGQGFGTTSPRNPLFGVLLGNRKLTIASWSDTSIRARLPTNAIQTPAGPYQLSIRTSASDATVNGITFHLRGTGYSPTIWEVGVGRTYDPNNYDGASRGPIQHAIDDAIAQPGNDLIVVYPGQKGGFNTFGSYFENLVIYGPVKLQGVGPGGIRSDGTFVDGVHIDGRAIGGDSPYSTWWRSFVTGTLWNDLGGWDGSEVDADGSPRIYEGPVISVFAEDGEFGSGFRASIDGFVIEGGDQQGFPANVDMVTGAPTGAPPNVVVQGGGVFVNAFARHLQITNNLIQSNGGAYAGGIRVGTPHLPSPLDDLQNDAINISYNRLIANGGSNLAGAIGLFNGAEGYKVSYNDICGNFSVEYGGGVSHYGMSPNGEIAHNRILFNRSNDEGGGIMIAGELPVDPTILSPGAGPVKVHANLIQGNISNDDGGGLRFLMSGTATYEVFNNMIANNVSTHEGGGISINDAPNVRVYNNTIMKNITTATSMTSYGLPAPAGLSTSRNSNLLQAALPPASPIFSNPVVFDNVFWDNRAATRTSLGLAGIGLAGDPNPIHYWDMGVSDGIGELDPGYSLLTVPYGPSTTNLDGLPPAVVEEYDLAIQVWPWRGNPNFLWTEVVAVEAPPGEAGDYHLRGESPARNSGTKTWMDLNSAIGDYDSQCRSGSVDMGADEYGAGQPACP
jgi:hypothetical protein